MNKPLDKLIINKEKQLKSAKKHIFRMLLLEFFLILLAFINGLFNSGNNIQIIIVLFILILSFLYLLYIINKYYKITISSIELIDFHYYLITYHKWFSSVYSIQVQSDKLNISVNKIDPNSGTIAFSSITFYNKEQSFKFKTNLYDLKNILIFCWEKKPYNLSKSEVWDIKEISNYKGFEGLKKIL